MTTDGVVIISAVFLFFGVLLAVVAEIVTRQNNAHPDVAGVMGALTLGALAAFANYVANAMIFRGHFWDLRPDNFQLTVVPTLLTFLYVIVRFSFFRIENTEDKPGLRRGLTTLRGAKESLSALKKAAAREGEAGALLHPKLRLPRSREGKHILLVGAPGSGKTQVLFPLLQDVLSRNEPAIIYDFKGDYTAAYAGQPGCIILSPFDTRGLAWDIAADLDTEIKIAEFSASLIPEAKAKEPFFRRAAQDVLTAVMVRLQHTRPGQWTFSDVIKILENKAEMLKTCAEFSPAALNSLGNGSNNQAIAIFGEIRTSTMQLGYLAKAWAGAQRRFSIGRWIRDEEYRSTCPLVILQGSQQYRHLEGFLTSMIFALVFKDILTLPDSHSRRFWAFLDEFGNLPAIEGLDTMLNAVRSKGLRVVAAIQDFAQVENAYSAAFSKTFFGSFGTVLAGISSGETAGLLSSYFGKNEVAREHESETKSRGRETRKSESKGTQIVVEQAFLDNDFATIPYPSLKVPATFWIKSAGWPAGKLLYNIMPTPSPYESNIKPAWMIGMGARPEPVDVEPESPLIVDRSKDRERDY